MSYTNNCCACLCVYCPCNSLSARTPCEHPVITGGNDVITPNVVIVNPRTAKLWSNCNNYTPPQWCPPNGMLVETRCPANTKVNIAIKLTEKLVRRVSVCPGPAVPPPKKPDGCYANAAVNNVGPDYRYCATARPPDSRNKSPPPG